MNAYSFMNADTHMYLALLVLLFVVLIGAGLINLIARRKVINGAAVYLYFGLAPLFGLWVLRILSDSSTDVGDKGELVGRLVSQFLIPAVLADILARRASRRRSAP